ncbi:MAG: ribonuclease HI [Chloroflexi bacterium]|nr:ribonuclease HI [Chloroflexota bacterium]|tara:strand:+ start:1028 stop:1495 length:468 start_codon:yes stop_codon:yes gene_type:complete
MHEVTIYTDGSCLGNPGPGGIGVVLISEFKQKEISAGYRLTTNNRMELLAVIRALEALKTRSKVNLYTDSSYVVNALTKGWAVKWKQNNWKLSSKKTAKNIDLWKILLDLDGSHDVTYHWVKGHAGNINNERCDELAREAAYAESHWNEDSGFDS